MKRQANALTAVLENWQDVENAIDIYANSAGSALRENEIYLDSWEAKSKAVSSAWNELVNTFLNSGWIKGFLDGSQKVLSFLTDINGMIPVLIGLIAGGLTTALTAGWSASEKLSWSLIKVNILSGGLPIVIGLLTTGVGMLISWSISASDTAKQIENLTNKIEEQQKAIDELNAKEKEATDLYKEYASLMSKSNTYGLSTEEKENLLKISNDLVETYGLEVEGIDSVTGAYIIGANAINDYVEALKRERDIELEKQTGTRNDRIEKNINSVKKNSAQYDTEQLKKDIGVYVQKNAYDKEKSYQSSGGGYDATGAMMSGQYKKFELPDYVTKIDNPVVERLIKQTELTPEDIAELESALVKDKVKYNAVTNSIVKDLLTNIQVDNSDILDSNGESLLTQLLTPFLTTVDWDEFKQDEFEVRVKEFATHASETLSEVATKLQDAQSKMTAGELKLTGYEDMYNTLQNQVGLLKKMLDQDIIDEDSYNKQLAQITQQISNNIGLAMVDIGSKISETDEASKQNFKNVADNFIALENQFRQGSITSTQYLDSLTSTIENMDFTETFGQNKVAAQQFFATFTGKTGNLIQDTLTQFEAGKISVDEYGDKLVAFAKQQKALAEQAKSNGFISDDTVKELETQNKAIDEAAKKWEELNDINTYLDENMSTLNSSFNSSSSEYQNFATGLYNEFSKLSDDTKNTIISNMQQMEGFSHITAENLQKDMLSSVGTSKALAEGIALTTNDVFKNLAQNGGEVLSALGTAIKGFEYTIKFTAEMQDPTKGTFKVAGIPIPFEVPNADLKINGIAGEGAENVGQSLIDLGNSLSIASEFIDFSDYGSSTSNSGKSTGNKPSGGGKSGGSGSGGGSNKDTVNEQLKKDIEKKKSEIEAIDTSIELQGLRIDIADESDYITRIDAVAEKYDLVSEKTKRLTDEYNRLNAITPATEEQAETLKNRMGELVGEISNNIKETTELRRELELLSIEMISSSAEKAERQLERTTKRLDRDLKNITEGNVFDDSMFNMSVDMPKVSTSAVKKKRENNDSIVEEQQKRADEVFGIVQKSNQDIADENAVARLVEEENLAIHNENKLIEEQEYADENLGIIQEMTDGIESDITASNIFLENNPIEPQMDTTEFETEYNKLKDMVSSIQGMMNDGVPIEVDSSSARNRRYTNTSNKANINGSEEGDGTSNYTMKVTSPSLTESDNLQAAYQASKLIGTPYIWGGTSTTGFDCSGLIYYVYGGLGKNIGRVADAQYHSGTPVDKSNLRMGDLVFYGTPEEATHVGMYIGKGMMIHSAGGRDNTADNPGRGVCRQSIDYRGDYLGARRYAAGTPKGNEYGKYTGIMAENYKPEILINKVTGEMTYHDTPTAFDIRKYDVMGEDMTASLPKFAKGTVDPMEIAQYIREKYPEITNEGIAGILGNIYAESGFNQYASVVEGYGSGSNRQVTRRGFFQLDDERISNWSSIVASGDWRKQIDTALAEGRYKNSGMGNSSKHNMWQYLTDTSLSASEQATLWDKLYERSNGAARNTRIAKANEYFNQLKDGIDSFVSSISDPYEGYKNKEEKRRLETYIEEHKVEDYYDKEFANDYIPFLNERKASTQAIRDEIKELYKLEADSEEFTAKRQRILDDLNTQTLTDTERFAEISKKNLQRSKEENQAYYDGLLEQFETYVDKVNSGEEVYDEKVYTEYITALDEQADRISDITEQITESTQNIIDAYEQLEEINRRKKQESIISMQTENEEWEQRYNIDKNPKWLRYGLENYDRIIEEEAKNKAEYHTEANDVRDQYVAEENSEIQELLQNYNDTFWEFEEYKNKVNSGEATYDEKVFAKYEATLKDGLENIEVRDGALEYIKENWDSFFDKEGNTTAAYDEALRTLPEEVLDDFKIVISRVSGKKQGWWESEQNLLSAQETLRSEQIDSLITAYQYEIDRYQKVVEKEQERNELEISRLSAKTNLLQKHYDLTNSIRQEQHNINKELQASMTQYAYLDKETRKLLFNQEDYVALTEELTLASREAERIQRNYLNEINNADVTNIDEITAKYERQYELAMKKYEIAKAELEVSKKRQQLDNVLAEKNVRMLINGQWQWVANTQEVINAQNELADAEYARETAELGVSQTSSLHSLQEKQNSLETANNVMNEQINDMTENLERIQEVLEGEPLSIASVLSQIAESGGNGIADIVNRFGREFTDLVNFIADFNGHNRYDYKDIVTQTKNITSPSYGVDGKANVYKSNDYMLAIDEAIERGDLNAALAANKIRDDKIDYLGLDVDKLTEEDIKKKINQRNASGTKSAKMGLSKVNEEGLELIHTNFGDLIPLEGGESIFSNLQTEKLWEWSQYRPNDFLRMFDLPNLTLNNKQGTNVTEYNLYGDVKVDSAVDADDMLNAISNRFRTKQ